MNAYTEEEKDLLDAIGIMYALRPTDGEGRSLLYSAMRHLRRRLRSLVAV